METRMPGLEGTLDRCRREREAALERGDLEVVALLDRAIEDLEAKLWARQQGCQLP
jgi:hypothetical protein